MGAAALSLVGGCGGGRASNKQVVKTAVERELKKNKDELAASGSNVSLEATNNEFRADDAKGNRILEARVGKLHGGLDQRGVRGPARFESADCRLFEKGKLSLNLKTPEATWDGKHLTTDKTAHAVTPDGKTVMDAQKAVWTRATGHLDLTSAKLQSMKAGKVDFSAEGPRAEVLNHVVTMPAGGKARNAEGQQLEADHIRWFMDTGKLEARGHVVLSQDGTVITGQRLTADTKLKRGHLRGAARVKLTRLSTPAGTKQALVQDARGKRKEERWP